MSSPSLLARLRADYGAKAVKYATVSVVNVFVGQGLLFFFSKIVGLTFVEANVLAVSISAVPAFILSRRWIWQLTTRSHFVREVVPFWSIAFLGLLLSTGLVAVAQQFSDATWVLMVTNLFSFGMLWVGKFFFLDKVLFGAHHHEFDDDLAEEVAELEAQQRADGDDPDARENVGEATA